MDLLPIGRFARITGLTVRALRHYDELGLLAPARVDGETGYRYYAGAQSETAETIRRVEGRGRSRPDAAGGARSLARAPRPA